MQIFIFDTCGLPYPSSAFILIVRYADFIFSERYDTESLAYVISLYDIIFIPLSLEFIGVTIYSFPFIVRVYIIYDSLLFAAGYESGIYESAYMAIVLMLLLSATRLSVLTVVIPLLS